MNRVPDPCMMHLHQRSVHADACSVSVKNELLYHGPLHSLCYVGVAKDNEGRLAAKLHRGRSQVFGSCHGHPAACCRTSCESHLGYCWVLTAHMTPACLKLITLLQELHILQVASQMANWYSCNNLIGLIANQSSHAGGKNPA